jgi:hypothetical protein
MVIDNFHIESVSVPPLKTNTPLIVNADAVLSFSVAFEQFQFIARRLPAQGGFKRLALEKKNN